MWHPTLLFRIAFVALAVGLALPLVAVFRDVPAGTAPRLGAVYASAWFAAFYWWVGAGLVLAGRGETPSGAARAWWATGCAFAGLHVAVAMHAAHGWSHAAAYDHTAAVGGWGPGVFVNYAFVLVWAADAAWMCLSPGSYGQRPWWATWAVQGLLAFVVFNAAVVFGHGPLRWAAAAAFAWLAWEVWADRRRARP
ncbi:MAG: hypothetical protein K2X82_24045 [Gemmataceae bacterium]|nr:hypothetical protein [Gemmataceae bacterium]